jgi:hypothetical protein
MRMHTRRWGRSCHIKVDGRDVFGELIENSAHVLQSFSFVASYYYSLSLENSAHVLQSFSFVASY